MVASTGRFSGTKKRSMVLTSARSSSCRRLEAFIIDTKEEQLDYLEG